MSRRATALTERRCDPHERGQTRRADRLADQPADGAALRQDGGDEAVEQPVVILDNHADGVLQD